MVKALLDTNILVDFLNAIPQAKAEIDRYRDRAVSIVTWIEVMVGAPGPAAAGTKDFLTSFEVIGLDRKIAERAVSLRQTRRIKLPDAIIWATAQETGSLLVTRNHKDFPDGDPSVRIPYDL